MSAQPAAKSTSSAGAALCTWTGEVCPASALLGDRLQPYRLEEDAPLFFYLRYCGQAGLGNYDLARIDIRGASIASVQKKYRLHTDVDRELQWMAPLDVEDGSWIGPKGVRTDGKPNVR